MDLKRGKILYSSGSKKFKMGLFRLKLRFSKKLCALPGVLEGFVLFFHFFPHRFSHIACVV